jgi:hypothetical protein
VASQAALGERPFLEVFGTDYPTPDGTCIRDYIHVCDLVRAYLDALRYLRAGGKSEVLNCGYGEGFSVLDVISAVKRAAKTDFPVRMCEHRPGDPASLVAGAERIHKVLGWEPKLNDLDTIVSIRSPGRSASGKIAARPLNSRFCLCSALSQPHNRPRRRIRACLRFAYAHAKARADLSCPHPRRTFPSAARREGGGGRGRSLQARGGSELCRVAPGALARC